MTAMEILSGQPWVERLGWTLVHFLWQGLSVAVLYAAARRSVARTSSPNVRYLLACAALAAMMAAPLVTWSLMHAPDALPGAAYRIRSTPPAPAAADVVATLPASVHATVSSVQPTQFLLWVVMLWLAGAMVFWVRLTGGWVLAARMRSVAIRQAPPEWQDTLGKLGARIGVSRPVRLLVSALVPAPTVVGWLRPLVLVPVGALSGLPAGHLEALLLHELAHIRRHDYLVNLLQSVAEALLFYHPAVWWVSGHIRAERELCCDDVAVSISGDAFNYARALAQVESYRAAHSVVALAANGGPLADRIARLLGQSRPAVARSGLGPGVLAVAVLLVAAAYGLFGHTGEHPAFLVASIKQNPNQSTEPTRQAIGVGYRPGGRLTATNASLKLLIRFAYAAHDNPMLGHSLPLLASQVVGGPAWIGSINYDIEAKAAGNTDPKHAWLMLQTLLADRFKLALHRETRNLPVYDLTPAKSGLKLPPAAKVGCVSFLPGTQPHYVPGKVDCGYVSGPYSANPQGVLHIKGIKVHMADLIRELAFVLDRPVLDKTGFTGEFDVDLRFIRDDATIGLAESGGRTATDPNLPGIFVALEEQLGLKLVADKGQVETLVVDHAEKPSAN